MGIISFLLTLTISFVALLASKKIFFELGRRIFFFFALLYKDDFESKLEMLYNKNRRKVFIVLTLYKALYIIECFLLVTIITIFIFFASYNLLIRITAHQLFSLYTSTTLTLILTCYTSQFYGKIYELFSKFKKKNNDTTLTDDTENHSYTDSDKKAVLYILLIDSFFSASSKKERFRDFFREDKFQLFACVAAFCIIVISRIELIINISLVQNVIWMDFNRIALESSVTFIAFDRIYNQCRKIKDKKAKDNERGE
ncbi:MAG: hypothetical protein FWC70_04820 [Defluviitaleaceae bacterium]|nr:hypothetical protein [Defluviitaleaceae bacterium]